MFVDGSGQNEQSLERTFHRCFLPSFTSFGWGVSEEKIKMWKVNRRRMSSDGKSSRCLWQGELKKVDDKQKISYDLSNCPSILNRNQRFIYVICPSIYGFWLPFGILKRFFQSHMSCASGGGHFRFQFIEKHRHWYHAMTIHVQFRKSFELMYNLL